MSLPNYVAWPGMDIAKLGAPSVIMTADAVSRAYGYAYGIEGMGFEHLHSDSRLRHIVTYRQACMYMMHKVVGHTATMVGQIMAKDHATVLHGCRKVSGYLTYDKRLRLCIGMAIDALVASGFGVDKSDHLPVLKNETDNTTP